ncbi:MAG: DUF6796 family protein [Bacteroidota bacterium]
MNTSEIVQRLLVFAAGALLLITGDYLYGTTYYTNVPDDTTRFLVSGLLGLAASASYWYGLSGYGASLSSAYRYFIIGGFSLFTLGVAATHTLASAHMVAFNQRLLTPHIAELNEVFNTIDYFYEIYFIPMGIGLVVGYGALLVAILRQDSVFPRWTLWFHPLLIVTIIAAMDASFEGYPIALKSPAISAICFNLALVVSLRRTSRGSAIEKSPK